jgi:gp16 family phage-associated protein
MKQDRVKVLRERLVREGKTVRQLAEEKRLNYRTVICLLNGVNKGMYGESHRAAVALGLK